MQVIQTKIPDVKILKPRIFSDERGFFMESYNQKKFDESIGLDINFVQDNHSRSSNNVLRGLHYQTYQPQGKLIRVVVGKVFDVVVDLRKSSSFYGQHVSVVLSEENHEQLWIPPGFAHGFLVLSKYAECLYKTTDFYAPDHERCIIWNDPELAIDWPLVGEPLVSDKDSKGLKLSQAEVYP